MGGGKKKVKWCNSSNFNHDGSSNKNVTVLKLAKLSYSTALTFTVKLIREQKMTYVNMEPTFDDQDNSNDNDDDHTSYLNTGQ